MLRINFAPHLTYPPWVFPCAAEQGLNADGCTHPGIDVETTLVLSRQLNGTPTVVNSPKHYDLQKVVSELDVTYDLLAMAIPMDMHRQMPEMHGLLATVPILYLQLSVVISDQPVSVQTHPFNVFQPFGVWLWLLFGLLIVGNKLYARLLQCQCDEGTPSWRRLRLRTSGVTTNLVPASLGVAVLVSLYRGGLLTRLLMTHRRYLIENVDDLTQLPADIQLYTNIWTEPMIRNRINLTRDLKRIGLNDDEMRVGAVVDELRQGRAAILFVQTSADAFRHKYGPGLRVVTLHSLEPVKCGYLLAASQMARRDALSRAINEHRGLIDVITARYRNYIPRDNNLMANTDTDDDDSLTINLSTLRGVFLIFATFIFVAFAVLTVEVVQPWSLWRTKISVADNLKFHY